MEEMRRNENGALEVKLNSAVGEFWHEVDAQKEEEIKNISEEAKSEVVEKQTELDTLVAQKEELEISIDEASTALKELIDSLNKFAIVFPEEQVEEPIAEEVSEEPETQEEATVENI